MMAVAHAPAAARAALRPVTVMLVCQVKITLKDGSFGEHTGLYRTTFDATERALVLFPDAARIDVNCLSRGAR
jgi:hypothetical protein